MTIKPNQATAAAAGVWAAVGGMAFEHWHAAQHAMSDLTSNLLWGGVMLVFVLVPLFYLVIGPQPSFGRDWVKDPAERERYFQSVKRLLVWLASGVVVYLAWKALRQVF